MKAGLQPESLSLRYDSLAQTAGMLECSRSSDFSFHLDPFGITRQKMHLHMAFSKAHAWLKNPPADYVPSFSISELGTDRVIVEGRKIIRRDHSGILHDKLGIWLDSSKPHVLTIHAPASLRQRVLFNTYWNPRLNLTIGSPSLSREEYETIGSGIS